MRLTCTLTTRGVGATRGSTLPMSVQQFLTFARRRSVARVSDLMHDGLLTFEVVGSCVLVATRPPFQRFSDRETCLFVQRLKRRRQPRDVVEIVVEDGQQRRVVERNGDLYGSRTPFKRLRVVDHLLDVRLQRLRQRVQIADQARDVVVGESHDVFFGGLRPQINVRRLGTRARANVRSWLGPMTGHPYEGTMRVREPLACVAQHRRRRGRRSKATCTPSGADTTTSLTWRSAFGRSDVPT